MTKYKITKTKMKFWRLIFDESVPTVEFKTDLPFLIDAQNRVLAGNCLRFNYNALDIVECVVVQMYACSKHLYEFIKALECKIAKENNVDRLYLLERDLKDYLSDFNKGFEELSLFSTVRQVDFITEENYLLPLPVKMNKTKKKEDDEIESFFSRNG